MKRSLAVTVLGAVLTSAVASAEQARISVSNAEIRDLGARGMGVLVELDLPDLQGYVIERGVLAVANSTEGTRDPVEVWAVGADANQEPAFDVTGRTQVSFGPDEIACDITNLLHCIADGAQVESVWLVRPQSALGTLDAGLAQSIAAAFDGATLRVDLHSPFQGVDRH